jgi:hypothetical protein
MPQPQTFLLQILVTVNSDGSLTTQIRSLYDSKVKTDPLSVNVGDRIGWLVQVVIANDRKLLPYTVDFSKNTSFFGVSSLNVPAGGASPFLVVLALQDNVKYTVDIPGLTNIDPDIQSGGDTSTLGGVGKVSTAYSVYWDTAQPANRMTYSVAGGPKQPLPLTVALGDQITFNSLVGVGAIVANFTIAFTASNGWASPFNPNQGKFPAAGANTAVGPLGVKDPVDPGASFPFYASITLNGASVSSPSDPNNAIVMSAVQADQRQH